MTIRPGEQWGAPGPLTPDAPVLPTDAASRRHLQALLDDARPLGEIGLIGGDLHRTLGSPRHDAAALRSGHGMRFSVDVGVVRLDDAPDELLFVAHLVAGPGSDRRLWSVRTVTAMNAQFLGPLDLAPRGHPNDGRLDLIDGSLPIGQRRKGRRRARTGTHVPHPDLAQRRIRDATVEFASAVEVRLDGEPVALASRIHLRCEPDALTVVV